MSCIFCKIISKEIPKEFTYEDSDVVAFPDIRPLKPIHLLVMPKVHIADFMTLENDRILAKIRKVIQALVKEHKLEGKGFRIVVNGAGAQIIDHLHFHLMGPMGKAVEM